MESQDHRNQRAEARRLTLLFLVPGRATLMAAEATERICYGLEIDTRYVDVIIAPWQHATEGEGRWEGAGRRFEDVRKERNACAPTAV